MKLALHNIWTRGFFFFSQMFSSVKLLAIFSDNHLIMFCRKSIISKLDSVRGARRFAFSKDHPGKEVLEIWAEVNALSSVTPSPTTFKKATATRGKTSFKSCRKRLSAKRCLLSLAARGDFLSILCNDQSASLRSWTQSGLLRALKS